MLSVQPNKNARMKRGYLSVGKIYLKWLCVRFWHNDMFTYEMALTEKVLRSRSPTAVLQLFLRQLYRHSRAQLSTVRIAGIRYAVYHPLSVNPGQVQGYWPAPALWANGESDTKSTMQDMARHLVTWRRCMVSGNEVTSRVIYACASRSVRTFFMQYKSKGRNRAFCYIIFG